MTTKQPQNAGNVAANAKKNMENSRRNATICVWKAAGASGKAIAMEYGLAQSTVSVILQKGLEHWREWERKGVEAGVLQDDQVQEVAGDPDNRGITMIPIHLIAPNPWQPRTEIDDSHVIQTAEDIFRQGLLFPILVRENGLEGGFELVDGQVRLEAFRYLDSLEWDVDQVTHNDLDVDPSIDGTWASRYYADGETTMIPAIVRFMSPAEVILASLSANVVRRDLSWLDETRAYRQALDADVGLSQRQLAKTVGVSPTNLSTRLSMLKLPSAILELVNADKLAWTTARELLGFVGATHIHQEELDYVARALPRSRVIKDGRKLSATDVKEFMLNAMGHSNHGNKWEHLSVTTRNVYLGNMGEFKPAPVMSPAEFMDENFDHLHSLPGAHGVDHITWTCRGQQWRGAQDRWKEEQARERAEEAKRVAELTKDDEVPAHPEAGMHKRVEGNQLTVDQYRKQQARERAEEAAGQQQDLAFADIPSGNTEPNVVSIDQASGEVELHEDTWSYMHAVRDSLEDVVAADVWPTREELGALASNLERARNAILAQLQGSFPDDAA